MEFGIFDAVGGSTDCLAKMRVWHSGIETGFGEVLYDVVASDFEFLD